MLPTSPFTARKNSAPAPSRRRASSRLPLVVTACVALGLQLVQACGFSSPRALETPQTLYAVLAASPYVDESTISGNRWRVIDDNLLKVDHGYTCASAPNAASDKYIGSKLADEAILPPSFDGTVFLNGWYLEYPSEDHHVLGLGAVIFDIGQNGRSLTWHAGGVLSDHYADDTYVWCYQYTIVAWQRQRLDKPKKPFVDLQAAHANASGKLVFVDDAMGSNDFTAKTSRYQSRFKPSAKLLAGFGVTFDDDDHHLLQFAMDVGGATVKRKGIKWTTDVILKDNSARSFGYGQLATVLGGKSVRVFNPDFTFMDSGAFGAPDYFPNNLHLSPRDDASTCIDFGQTIEHVYNYRIDDVPYQWAVPMLTGWDVGLACDDEHVKKIGAWIESFDYVRNPQTGKGTLTYTVRTILQDKQPDSELVDGVQVEILGIDPVKPNV